MEQTQAIAPVSEQDTPEQQEPTEHTETCPKHGDFTAKRYSRGPNWRGDPDYRWTTCPTCKQEREQAEATARAESARKYREELIAARIEHSGIPTRFKGKTLENFQVENEEQRIALDLCRRYVAEFKTNFAEGRALVLCGAVGTGKTLLGCALLHAVGLMGGRIAYLTVSDLIFRLRKTWAKDSAESESDVLNELCDLDLLVLDEVGVQFGSDGERVQLFNVINGRYNLMRPMIVISNLDVAGMTAYLGERAVDRLRENGGQVVVFKGQSWRSRQAR